MKSIRITVLGAAAMAFSMPMGLSLQAAPAAAETEACACTCAACVAKHGAKLASKPAETPKAAAPEAAQKPVAAPAPNLPDAPTDIEAEIARILATDLEAVDLLLAVEGSATGGVGAAADESLAPSGERGFMGISLGMNEAGGGALIGSVGAGSPAESAGLQVDDLIVAAEGMPVESAEELVSAIIDLKVGQTASLEVERGDEELEFEVVLGKRPASTPAGALPSSIASALGAMGYTGDEEVEVEVVLPSGSPTLLQVEEQDETVVLEGVVDGTDGAQDGRQLFIFEAEGTAAPGSKIKTVVGRRWPSESPRAVGPPDALPEGYVEIMTTRERRPASVDEMRRRMTELEREVAELSKLVAELRAELDRRNPR